MKRTAVKQHKVNLTENNQNEVDFKKIKLEETSLPLSSSVKFLTFCKKTAKKKLQGFNQSGK